LNGSSSPSLLRRFFELCAIKLNPFKMDDVRDLEANCESAQGHHHDWLYQAAHWLTTGIIIPFNNPNHAINTTQINVSSSMAAANVQRPLSTSTTPPPTSYQIAVGRLPTSPQAN
jgi:hypothetical protein